MIEFKSEVFPFSGLDSCGDFAAREKREDGDLLVVGDVAGHGQPVVGQIAQSCLNRVKANKHRSLEQILCELEQIPGISERGVSIFLGLFDRSLPLLHYYLLGDLTAYHIKGGEVQRLSNNEAPLGLKQHRKFRSIKVEPKELFAISSDGLKLSFDKQVLSQANTPIGKLFQHLLDLAKRANDDGVLAVARVRGTSPTSVGAKIKRASTEPSQGLKEDRTGQPNREQHPESEITSAEVRPVDLLSPDAKIGELSTYLQVRPYLQLLWELFEVNAFDRSRLESFALQILEQLEFSLTVFSESNLLQIQLESSTESRELLVANFSPNRVQETNGVLALSLPCQPRKPLSRDDRLRLTQQLSPANYKAEQARLKNDSLLAEQSKLAAMGEMVGAIAHQWRQPLNELALRIQRLQMHQHRKPLENSEVDTFSSESLELIQHMANTIDDFREFFSHGNDATSFDVRTVIDEVLRLHSAQLKNNNITTSIMGDSFEIKGQASHLKQILFNLISNSRDAFREHDIATPRIDILLDPNLTELCFTDNAGGVNEEKLERIFEPYYTSKEHGKGTGMGLYMCRMLATDHLHATINASNIEAEDPGLKITLRLTAAKD